MKTPTSFFCGQCGYEIVDKSFRKYITKAFSFDEAKIVHIGYICPKCASSTDISYPVKNIKQVHDFFDSLELYSFGRLIMKSDKKEKNKNK